jgi:hypothetical protein
MALSEHGNEKCDSLYSSFSVAYSDENGGTSMCSRNPRINQEFLEENHTK